MVYKTRSFLITCEISDREPINVLMEGCRVHADVDAWPLWAVESGDESLALKACREFGALDETWLCHFPTPESLEMFANLLSTIEFREPTFVRILETTREDIFTLSQFHKHVFHPA